MKTLSSTLQKGSAVLLLLAGLSSTTSQAQGNRNREQSESSRRDGGTRHSTFRDRPAQGSAVNTSAASRPPRIQNGNNVPRQGFNNNPPVVRNYNPRPDLNTNRPGPSNSTAINNGRRPSGYYNNRPGINRNNYTARGYYRPGPGYNRPGYSNYRMPRYNAYNPSWRYANLPRRNSVFNTISPSFLTINFGGYGYRYNNGIFYRPYNNVYTVITAPIGIRINILPIGYRQIYVNEYPYYYYNGTYYDRKADDDYVVVSPPVGAIVESIPDGYETLVTDGETYYVVDGAQYKPVVQENGEIWYEVIKAN